MELSAVAIWGNLAALTVTIALLGATLRLGRNQSTRNRYKTDPQG